MEKETGLSTLPAPIIELAKKLSHLVDMEKLKKMDNLSILAEVIDLNKLETIDPKEITELPQLACIVDMEKLAAAGDIGQLITIFSQLTGMGDEGPVEDSAPEISTNLVGIYLDMIEENPNVSEELKKMYLIPTDRPTEEFKTFSRSLSTLKRAPKELFSLPFKNYSLKGYALNEFVIGGYYNSINFEARDDDIYVVSYPKTGTTWMQEIAYLIANNLDFKAAKKCSLEERSLFIERPKIPLSEAKKMTSPRVMKTHLPYTLLPPEAREKKCKILYVTRNPKDTIVSCFHFYRMLAIFGFTGTFEQFIELFLEDWFMYSPFPKHVLEFWERRDLENIHFVKYEELIKDLPGEIDKIAKFLGKPLTSEQIKQIADHCSFKSMSENPATNYSQWDAVGLRKKTEATFMRKGKIGDWKNYFNEKSSKIFDEWYKQGFGDSDIKFTYE